VISYTITKYYCTIHTSGSAALKGISAFVPPMGTFIPMFEVNPIMISRWKAELANMRSVFKKSGKAEEPDIDTQD